MPAAAVVGEAMVALTLADALVEKFGGDSVAELTRAIAAWKKTWRAIRAGAAREVRALERRSDASGLLRAFPLLDGR